MSAFLDLLGWYLAASFTTGAVIAAVGYTRNTIRRSTR